MLIGLIGEVCAGKGSVAGYLVAKHGFQRLHISSPDAQPALNQKEAKESDVAFAIKSCQESQHRDSKGFPNSKALVEFVTKRWREHWVTTDIEDDASLELLLVRPFFLLVSIDAPISLRWQRLANHCKDRGIRPPSLEQFVLWQDSRHHDQRCGSRYFNDSASLKLSNTLTTLVSLHRALDDLNLTDESRLRPDWDHYFMQLASLAAQRSNCMKRRVGCVLVRERRVISTGYNGTPRNITNCNEGGCSRCNGGQGGGAALSTCLCLHAEENALLEAGRERIREGAVLYCDTCPCLTCSVKIVQVGISEVVYSQGYNMDTETAAILSEGGVHLRQFCPPHKGLIDLGRLNAL